MLHFDVSDRIVFAGLMGVKMCAHCPHCNNEDSKYPCQSKFGTNSLPFGGTAGFCDSLAQGIEHQGEGTPHAHGLLNFVTPYQHRSLYDIHKLIEADDNADALVTSIKVYSEHLHREDHYDHEGHQANLPELEKAWKNNYADASHVGLCAKLS